MSFPGVGRKQARRGPLRIAIGLAVLVGAMATLPSAAAAAELGRDSALVGLLRDALAHRPELIQAEATVKADEARVPQAGALPDPVLSFGVQNDGFKGLQIGQMETSYWSIVGAQTLP